ncbi:MAG TPA: ATP-grasp domain-containing protein [Candidatus Bathyarchaeia archaeon]|nr:ATP-grasp domain-containing protein [Candidatus Bathyarchaeia archaeon]
MSQGGAPRLLLLVPTTTYRTEDFVEAARRLDVDLVVAAERPSTLAAARPEHLLTLPFDDPARAASMMREYARTRPIAAVVPVDDATTVVGAAIGRALGLRANAPAAVSATRDKHAMRERLARGGVPQPAFTVAAATDDPRRVAARVRFPCVLKPLVLSASRGVIRADDGAAFVAAWQRIAAILAEPEVQALGEGARRILVEDFVPGIEVALEGMLTDGALTTLAIFDKPDPLDGPFFEETIYVTPSRLPEPTQEALARCAAQAATALGLTDGPVHVELRGNDRGPWLIELAARSIGGLCSRTLSFGTGMSLEEIIVRHALGWPIASVVRERPAAGVMMIPIPKGGVLERVDGLEAARAVPGIEGVTISMHQGQRVVPLPEGSTYLGFIFSRAETPGEAEAALRRAHAALDFAIR